VQIAAIPSPKLKNNVAKAQSINETTHKQSSRTHSDHFERGSSTFVRCAKLAARQAPHPGATNHRERLACRQRSTNSSPSSNGEKLDGLRKETAGLTHPSFYGLVKMDAPITGDEHRFSVGLPCRRTSCGGPKMARHNEQKGRRTIVKSILTREIWSAISLSSIQNQISGRVTSRQSPPWWRVICIVCMVVIVVSLPRIVGSEKLRKSAACVVLSHLRKGHGRSERTVRPKNLRTGILHTAGPSLFR